MFYPITRFSVNDLAAGSWADQRLARARAGAVWKRKLLKEKLMKETECLIANAQKCVFMLCVSEKRCAPGHKNGTFSIKKKKWLHYSHTNLVWVVMATWKMSLLCALLPSPHVDLSVRPGTGRGLDPESSQHSKVQTFFLQWNDWHFCSCIKLADMNWPPGSPAPFPLNLTLVISCRSSIFLIKGCADVTVYSLSDAINGAGFEIIRVK